MKRNLAERRQRAANHIRLRRSIRAMSKASTLCELFTAISQMLDMREFVYASAELDCGGGAERNLQLLAREKESSGMGDVRVRDGIICWSWERGDIEAGDVLDSGRFWRLSLPLSTERAGWGSISLYRELGGYPLLLDVNYLCDLFQKEAALAAERILSIAENEQAHAPENAMTVSGTTL